MEPASRQRRLRPRYVVAGVFLLLVGAPVLFFVLDDDPVTRMPPKSAIPANASPGVRRNIEDLYSPDARDRFKAAIGLSGKPEAIPFLVPLLGDVADYSGPPQPEFSWAYVKQLLFPPEPEFHSNQVAWQAALALVSCGPRASENMEVVLRKSKNPCARAYAALFLGKYGPPSAEAALVAALTDPSDMVRDEAVRAFSSMKHKGCREAIPGLIAILKTDSRLRWGAACALGGMIDVPEALDALVAALDDKDWRVCDIIIYSLQGSKDARAVRGLIGALGHPNPQVRREAAMGLGCLARAGVKDPQAVEALMAAFADSMFSVRLAAVREIGCFKDPRATMALMALLDDPDMRAAAAHSLGTLGDRRAVPSLIQLLRDERFAQDAEAALTGFAGEDLGESPAAWAAWWEKNKDTPPHARP